VLDEFEPYEENESDADSSMEDLLEEVEFDLFLSALDLSGLEGYRDEEGFLELEDLNEHEPVVLPVVEVDYELEPLDGSISMLSDEERERIEELQPVVSDDASIADLEPLATPSPRVVGYKYLYRRIGTPQAAIEELPIIQEAESVELVDELADEVIVLVDGVFTINKNAVAESPAGDDTLKALADSVLHKGNA
jgi:hypothetical protein